MKAKLYLLLLLLSFPIFLFGQSFKEKKVSTKVTTAKVFVSGAELLRKGSVYLNKGKYKLILHKLSTNIDGHSVQVKGKGDFIILSSKYNQRRIETPIGSQSADSLRQEIKKIDDELLRRKFRKEVLEDKEILIASNKTLGSTEKGVTATELNQMLSLYETQLMKIQNEYFKIKKEEEKLNEKKRFLSYEMDNAGSVQVTTSGEIVVEIESRKNQTITLETSYFIKGAGWYPKYDIRAESISKPLKVEYKANVFQNTGIDWKDVKLTLSNGEPSKSGVKPQLEKWELNYARLTRGVGHKYKSLKGNNISGTIYDEIDGSPLPGVNIRVVGSSIGTVSDFDGHFLLTIPNNADELKVSYIGYKSQTLAINSNNIDVYLETDTEQLEEVVVVGYGSSRNKSRKATSSAAPARKKAEVMTASLKENTTTVDFEIEKKYSIKSGTGSITVSMKDYQIPAEYHYFAIPKLEKEAFLIAKIPAWDQYNFLEGEANLFLEGGYVGKTIVEANSFQDTLDISLGRDKSIVINRNKVDQFTKKKIMGGNRVATREFEIEIRNKKSIPIQIDFYDQIPVSVNSGILVETEGLSGGKLEEEDGFIKWSEEINTGESMKKNFKYIVKYPKNEKVILE